MMRWCLVLVVATAGSARAQSLFLRTPAEGGGGTHASSSLIGFSLIAIEAPEPTTFQVHDLVTIIIDEVSAQKSEQTMETDKSMSARAGLNAVVDPMQLLEARLRASADTRNVELINANATSSYKGEGESSRTDRFTAKVQGTVVDVKPNGNLVIEASTEIEVNGERQTILLSGTCRSEDVTTRNTILSSQLASKRLVMRTEGDVDKAGSKGILTKVLDSIFAF